MARIMSNWTVVIDGKEADVRNVYAVAAASAVPTAASFLTLTLSVTNVAEGGCVEVVTIKIYPREYKMDNETKTIIIDGLYKKVD